MHGEIQMKFSVVVPVRDEVNLVPKTLPSYLALKPDELLLCLDKPPLEDMVEIIEEVSRQCKAENIVKVLQVPKGEWEDQQMKARRTGFLEARNDRILTGDIDLIVNRNVLKAIALVGKNDIGMASCSKLSLPHNMVGICRLIGEFFLKKYVHHVANLAGKSMAVTGFTGLYALWRPLWLDAEPLDEAKQYSMVKRKIRDGKQLTLGDFIQTGEDSFLRDNIMKKHKVTYLPDIGATVLSDPLGDQPLIQYTTGMYFAMTGRNWLATLGRAFFRMQPYYLVGYMYGKRLKKVTSDIKKLKIELDREKFGYGKWRAGGTPVD